MLSETEERRTRLTLIYGPAFRRAFEIFALGTTDSPVRDDEVIELARSAGISKEQRILEPCSGSGGVSRLLTREFRCEVLGIDVVPYQLDVAKSKAAHEGFQSLIAYIEGDAVTYAYPREAFDAAIDVFAWVHVADWPDLFRTIHGALKPGGKIVMYDAFLTPKTKKQTEEAVKDKWFDPGIRTVEDCCLAFDRTGFRVIHREDRRQHVLGSWRAGLARLKEAADEFIGEFGEEPYELFSETISWTIKAHEEEELTAAQVVAEKV